jgi:WD40 repeat protein
LHFSPDGTLLASASWDRSVSVWPTDRLGQGRTLGHHDDIVAGCCFTPDGKRLTSWSYDQTVAVWEVVKKRAVFQMKGHTDRVLVGAVSADARWLATAARDRQVRLWDLQTGREAAAVGLQGEPRGACFLLDAETLILTDAHGRLTVHCLPDLQVRAELHTGLPVQCADLAPSGAVLALGCTDGRVCLVAVEGVEAAPLVVTASKTVRSADGVLRRLLGRSKPQVVYQCTCPACRRSFELPGEDTRQPTPCPGCRRQVRVCLVTQPAEPAAHV